VALLALAAFAGLGAWVISEQERKVTSHGATSTTAWMIVGAVAAVGVVALFAREVALALHPHAHRASSRWSRRGLPVGTGAMYGIGIAVTHSDAAWSVGMVTFTFATPALMMLGTAVLLSPWATRLREK
jgi:hypothetical protein